MQIVRATLSEQFVHSLSLWSIIVPAVDLGIVMGAIPGFAAHNTIIILLPLTLAFDVEVALVFMVALYCASHLGGGIPALLMNIPGTGGAAATPLDGDQITGTGEATKPRALGLVAVVEGGRLRLVATLRGAAARV